MKHDWQQVGENLYECSKCGSEIEGYSECFWACVPEETTDSTDQGAK